MMSQDEGERESLTEHGVTVKNQKSRTKTPRSRVATNIQVQWYRYIHNHHYWQYSKAKRVSIVNMKS